jgi:sterol desaturase/sphingolipid hydroxylase (fatty acid hydroxylase superfamily)
MIHSIFDIKGFIILSVIFVMLFLLESKFRLRRRIQNRWSRIWTNLLVSIPAFSLLRLLLLPVMVWIALKNQDLHIGINYLYHSPSWIKATAAFLMLDYINYLWHLINHKIPMLWRFHLVHHTDPDLDITTAFRFHFGELIGSVFFRGAAVFLTGTSPLTVMVYEIVFEAATQFHHSNWKLPFKLERILNMLFVTPRMHGIHHSVIRQETDSNFSVIFSIWDRIHHTIRLNVNQDHLVIGVPAYDKPDELTTAYLLRLPFTKIRSWKKGTEVRKPNELLPDKNKLSE